MSTNVLDDILNGASVVSENHDINTINVEAALADERELAKMYSREQIVAMRKDPKRKREAKEAAIKRASLDVSTGRVAMMSANRVMPWTGLGVIIDKCATAEEAIVFASMDWETLKKELWYLHNGETIQAKKSFALIRSDTGAELGRCGARYQPINNREGFSYLDGLLGEFGAHYETAGSLYGGEIVWILANRPAGRFEAVPGDVVEQYILFSNPHDGVSGCASAFNTGVRVVCANTHNTARTGAKSSIRIRHTGDIKSKIADARRALNLSVLRFDQYRVAAETMVETPVPSITNYANDVLDAVLDISAADVDLGADLLAASMAVTEVERDLVAKAITRKIKRRGEVLEDILARHESERCGIGGIRGSAWAAYNAVSEYADHGMSYKGDRDGNTASAQLNAASRRFESMIYGQADEMKQVAFEKALQYAE
jgi:phage/plasmid-like protein (TIGR03299 family)